MTALIQKIKFPASAVKVGALMHYAQGAVPDGWIVCGQAVSRTAYAALFAVIGTMYGPGDGETTFDLPPVDKFLLPSAVDVGAAIGSATHGHTVGGHALTVDEMPAHSIGISALHILTAPGGDTTGILGGTGNAPVTIATDNIGNGQAHTHSLDTGSNIPPSIKTLLCIKY